MSSLLECVYLAGTGADAAGWLQAVTMVVTLVMMVVVHHHVVVMVVRMTAGQ